MSDKPKTRCRWCCAGTCTSPSIGTWSAANTGCPGPICTRSRITSTWPPTWRRSRRQARWSILRPSCSNRSPTTPPRSSAFSPTARRCRDPLLAALVEPVLPAHPEPRMELIRACLQDQRQPRHPALSGLSRLADIAALFDKDFEQVLYLGDQFVGRSAGLVSPRLGGGNGAAQRSARAAAAGQSAQLFDSRAARIAGVDRRAA